MNDTVKITQQTKESNNYDEFYNTFYEIIGSYSFSMDDLYADTDALNVYMLLYDNTADSLNEAFKDYYQKGYKYRFSSFTSYWGKDEISDLVYTYTKNEFLGIKKWPLFEYEFNETQSKAARDAFVDFLMKKISEEGV